MIAGTVGALTLSGCVPASPDRDTYQDAAAQTLDTAVAELGTVELLLRLLEREDVTRPAAVAQLRYSEEGLDKSSSSFSGLTPPPSRDRLADRVGTALDDAADLIQRARTVVHRDRADRYLALARQLDRQGSRLERMEAKLR